MKRRILISALVPIFVAGFFILQKNIYPHENIAQGKSDDKSEMYMYGQSEYERGVLIPLSSADEPAVLLRSYKISGTATIEVWKADQDSVLNYLQHDDKNNQTHKNVDTSGFTLVSSSQQEITGSENNTKLSLPLDATGVWYVRTTLDSLTTGSFIVRSGMGAVVKEGDNKLVYWGQDFTTKRSIDDSAKLTVYNLQKGKKELFSTSFKNGIAQTDVSADADVAVIERGGDIAIIPINLSYINTGSRYAQFQNKQINKTYFVFTDRPLYQPGDKVDLKAIMRNDDDARYSVPSGKVLVEASNGWGDSKKVIYSADLDIDADGAVAGEFTLPADAATGYYTLEVKNDDKDTNGGDASFDVEYYQKPQYELNLDSDKNEVINGNEVSFDLSGNYFSGQPTAGQKVSYTIYSDNLYDYEYDSAGTEDNVLRDFWPGGEEVSKGEVTLGADGKYALKLPLTIPQKNLGHNQIFTIEATLQDNSENPSLRRKNVIVWAGNFNIFKNDNVYEAQAGKDLTLSYLLKSKFSASVSGIGVKADISRTWWEKTKKDSDKYPTYEKHVDKVGTQDFKSDGSGVAKLTFKPEDEGSYKIDLTAIDTQGDIIKQSFDIWASKNGYFFQDSGGSNGLSISLDKEKYKPGEKAQVSISSEVPDRDIFLSLDRGRMERFQIVHMDGSSAQVSLDLLETDMPDIYASVSSFASSRLDDNSMQIVVSPESKKMQVVITPDKEKYGPSDTVKLDIKTSDYQGKPLSADVAVWAVDKAIFELSSNNLPDVFNTFWRTRYDDTVSAHSLQGISTFGAEKGGGGGDVRSVFKDAAYWNPSVKTDSQGNAEVSFTLPDNLTTWTIASVGATKDTTVGSGFKDIVVSKEVIVRPILPRILRVGDSIMLSALVQNYSDKDHIFSVKLDCGDACSLDNQTQDVTVKVNESQQIFWKVNPMKENDAAEFTFSATAKDNAKATDTIIQEIPIRALGFWQTDAQSQIGANSFPIKLVPDAAPDKTTIKLALAPSIVGSLPVAMKYLVDYPYGCVEQTTSRFVPAVIAKQNPSLFKDALAGKDIDDIINKGIIRLADHQNEDGGWRWWGYGGSDPFVTAYVAGYLQAAKNIGNIVDDSVLSAATKFLEPIADSTSTKKEDRTRRIFAIYALSILNDSHGKVMVGDFTDLDPDTLAVAVLANLRNGYKDANTNGLSILINLGVKQGDLSFWNPGAESRFGSIDASTALAIKALVAAGGADNLSLAGRAAQYLSQTRKADYWSNTYATAQAVSALTEYAKAGHELNPSYAYTIALDGQEISRGIFSDVKNSDEISVPADKIKKEGSQLTVNKSGTGQIYSTLSISQFRADTSKAFVSGGLKIDRQYINERGNYPLAVGDTVIVRMTVTNTSGKTYYGVIQDELPSGMVPINVDLKNEATNSNVEDMYKNIDDIEYAENGAILSVYQVKTGTQYQYKARVVNAGTFWAPPAVVSLMYNPGVVGRTAFEKITIGATSVQSSLATTLAKSKQILILILALIPIIIGIYFLVKRKRNKTLI